MVFIIQILLLLTLFSLSQQECNMIQSEPFSCSDIVASLKYHNERRNDVALGRTKLSGAKNMWQLKWDEELAVVAHNHAKKCELKHNNNRPKGTGENISWDASSSDAHQFTADSIRMMAQWYDEINNYAENGNSNGTVGHFTQMVWADTKFVGCGMAYYEDRKNNPNYPYCTILVCDYRPAGNIKGVDMYIKYNGSDKCDVGVTSQMFKGLCAHDAKHARTGDTCSSEDGLDKYKVYQMWNDIL